MYDAKKHKSLIERFRNMNQTGDAELFLDLLEASMEKCKEDMLSAEGEEVHKCQGAAKELRDLHSQLKRKPDEKTNHGKDGHYR